MSSVHTLTSVPAVRYRDTSRDARTKANRELVVTGALFAALVIIGTAVFFAVAPAIADIASLYASTT
jgi:hypothetical protein